MFDKIVLAQQHFEWVDMTVIITKIKYGYR